MAGGWWVDLMAWMDGIVFFYHIAGMEYGHCIININHSFISHHIYQLTYLHTYILYLPTIYTHTYIPTYLPINPVKAKQRLTPFPITQYQA